MQWSTIEELVKDLNLTSKPNDYEALKRELRVMLSKLHPDKSGGDFTDDKTETQYNTIASAYEFVSHFTDDQTALVRLSQLPAIIKAVRETQIPPPAIQIAALRTECRAEARSSSHDRHILPKVGSGTFAAICASLLTFSGSLKDNPLIGQLSQNPDFHALLLCGVVISAFLFGLSWMHEKREQESIDWFMSERGRLAVFDQLLIESRHPAGRNTSGRISVRSVIDALCSVPDADIGLDGHPMTVAIRIVHGSLKNRVRIPVSAAEKIAEIYLLELERRGAIHKVSDASLDAVYEFDKKLWQNV